MNTQLDILLVLTGRKPGKLERLGLGWRLHCDGDYLMVNSAMANLSRAGQVQVSGDAATVTSLGRSRIEREAKP